MQSFLRQRLDWKHITSPWDSHHWSRYSRKQKGTRWRLERLLSEGRGEERKVCGVKESLVQEGERKKSCVTKQRAWSGCSVLTLCTPKVPKGRGLLVFVSIRRTSASSIMLWPPGKAWGMYSLKWATWNINTDTHRELSYWVETSSMWNNYYNKI